MTFATREELLNCETIRTYFESMHDFADNRSPLVRQENREQHAVVTSVGSTQLYSLEFFQNDKILVTSLTFTRHISTGTLFQNSAD